MCVFHFKRADIALAGEPIRSYIEEKSNDNLTTTCSKRNAEPRTTKQ